MNSGIPDWLRMNLKSRYTGDQTYLTREEYGMIGIECFDRIKEVCWLAEYGQSISGVILKNKCRITMNKITIGTLSAKNYKKPQGYEWLWFVPSPWIVCDKNPEQGELFNHEVGIQTMTYKEEWEKCIKRPFGLLNADIGEFGGWEKESHMCLT